MQLFTNFYSSVVSVTPAAEKTPLGLSLFSTFCISVQVEDIEPATKTVNIAISEKIIVKKALKTKFDFKHKNNFKQLFF